MFHVKHSWYNLLVGRVENTSRILSTVHKTGRTRPISIAMPIDSIPPASTNTGFTGFHTVPYIQ